MEEEARSGVGWWFVWACVRVVIAELCYVIAGFVLSVIAELRYVIAGFVLSVIAELRYVIAGFALVIAGLTRNLLIAASGVE